MGLQNAIKTTYFLCLLLCVAQADILSFLKGLDLGLKHSHRHATASPDSGPLPSAPKPSDVPDAPVSGSGVFDVTKYGAVADGKHESSQAFLKAWTAACSHGGKSTMLIPKGEFLLGAVEFPGPCGNGSPAVVIQGTLKAVPERSAFPEESWIEFYRLDGLTMSGGGMVDGQGQQTWDGEGCPGEKCKNPPISLKFRRVTKAAVHDLYIQNSKGFHLNFYRCHNVKLYNLDISAPEDSPNTDGIHLSKSTSIHISDSNIGVGDDCISIGAGNQDIAIEKVFCGPGHGISVGSLGKYDYETAVKNIHVKNCTLIGTTNGVRIKTWPDSPVVQADNFTFEDIYMSNAQFPIIIDQKYCPSRRCSDEPSNVKISNILYKNIKGISYSKLAVNLDCSSRVPCENIRLDNVDLQYQDPEGKLGSLCYHAHVSATGVQNPPPCLLHQ